MEIRAVVTVTDTFNKVLTDRHLLLGYVMWEGTVADIASAPQEPVLKQNGKSDVNGSKITEMAQRMFIWTIKRSHFINVQMQICQTVASCFFCFLLVINSYLKSITHLGKSVIIHCVSNKMQMVTPMKTNLLDIFMSKQAILKPKVAEDKI